MGRNLGRGPIESLLAKVIFTYNLLAIFFEPSLTFLGTIKTMTKFKVLIYVTFVFPKLFITVLAAYF